MLLDGRSGRRRKAVRRWHVHLFNRYFGADYDGRHLYQCRCGDLRDGI